MGATGSGSYSSKTKSSKKAGALSPGYIAYKTWCATGRVGPSPLAGKKGKSK
jgi:hypothetical protein